MSQTAQGILSHILAALFWGTAAPVVKISLNTLSPYTFIFIRMILSLIILTPILLPKLKSTKIKSKDILNVLVCGFLGITINIGAYFVGLSKTSVLDSSIIMSTTSIFTTIAAFFFLKEKVNRNSIVGIAISFFGIITILIQPILENGAMKFENMLGNIIVFFAMLGWVGYTILNKEISKKYDTLVLTYYSFVIGAISFLPLSASDIFNFSFYTQLTPFLIFAIIFETVFATIGSYLLFTWGLKYISATLSGVISYLNPISAIIISILFLNEKLTLPFIVGSVLIIIGIVVVEYHQSKKTKKNKHF